MVGKILIVDDDPEFAKLLEQVCDAGGFGRRSAASGRQALELARRHRFDLALLDIRLPDMDGKDLCAQIKRLDPAMKVILLTADGDPRQECAALNGCGADNFVEKLPLRRRDEVTVRLLARIRKQLPGREGGTLEAGALSLDLTRHTLSWNGQELPGTLGPREFRVIKFFMEHSGVRLAKADILAAVYGKGYSNVNALEREICRLRELLGDKEHRIIRTVIGEGYLLDPGVLEPPAGPETRPHPLLAWTLALLLLPLEAAAAGRWETFAELLYMRPTDGRNGYALVNSDAAKNDDEGSVASVKTGFAPGLRAGVTRSCANTATDMRLTFIYLAANGQSSVAQPPGGDILAMLRPANAALSSADRASAREEFRLVGADIDLGRNYGSSQRPLRLFFGLRYAEIRKTLRAIYFGDAFAATGDRVEDQYRFQGLGPRAGGLLELPLAGGLSMDAQAAGALLSGRRHRNFSFDEGPGGTSRVLTEDSRKLAPAVDFSLGLSYVHAILEAASLQVAMGYRFEHWPTIAHFQRIPNSTTEASSTDLTIDGFYLRAALGF